METEPTALLWLDPKELAANSNIRADLGDLDQLTASIAERGVLEPLLVAPDDEHGGYRVVAGHRRLAAALQASLAEVPVLVRPDLAGTAPTVFTQLAENEHRQALTTWERVNAYRQLKMEGVSQAAIAKGTATKPGLVKKLLAVGGSDVAVSTVASNSAVTLEQAAVLAEFDGDEPEVAVLVDTLASRPGQWDHTVARIRQARRDAQRVAKRLAELSEAGVACYTSSSEESMPETARQVYRLLSDDDEEMLDEEGHRSCPGRAVLLSAGWRDELSEEEWCLDPDRYGHKRPSWEARRDGNGTVAKSDEDKERESAERRLVLANNKAWRAAETVRRQFVRGVIAGKKLPDGALRFAVSDAVTNPERMAGRTDEDLLAELLGVEKQPFAWAGNATAAKAAADAPEGRLGHVLLAHVAAAHESLSGVHVWRNGDAWQASWLNFLDTAGYQLSDVEQLVVTKAAEEKAKRSRWTAPNHPADPDEYDDDEGEGTGPGDVYPDE